MAIMRWTPLLEPFEEIERAFGELVPQVRHGFTPAIDVYETKDSVIVETPLPGVEPHNVDVSIVNGLLTVQGSVEKKRKVDEKRYWRKEVRTGSFYRSVALPTAVVGEQAAASCEQGMLKISIPKSEEAKAKKVSITVT